MEGGREEGGREEGLVCGLKRMAPLCEGKRERQRERIWNISKTWFCPVRESISQRDMSLLSRLECWRVWTVGKILLTLNHYLLRPTQGLVSEQLSGSASSSWKNERPSRIAYDNLGLVINLTRPSYDDQIHGHGREELSLRPPPSSSFAKLT